MGVMHGPRRRRHHGGRTPLTVLIGRWPRPAGHGSRQAQALDQLHAEEMLAFVFADLVDRHDVRMIEVGGGLGFLTKTLHLGCPKPVAPPGSS